MLALAKMRASHTFLHPANFASCWPHSFARQSFYLLDFLIYHFRSLAVANMSIEIVIIV